LWYKTLRVEVTRVTVVPADCPVRKVLITEERGRHLGPTFSWVAT